MLCAGICISKERVRDFFFPLGEKGSHVWGDMGKTIYSKML